MGACRSWTSAIAGVARDNWDRGSQVILAAVGW
jgi:hypothetical protein